MQLISRSLITNNGMTTFLEDILHSIRETVLTVVEYCCMFARENCIEKIQQNRLKHLSGRDRF